VKKTEPSWQRYQSFQVAAAHGSTQEAALAKVQEAIDLWIETAKEFGDPIPKPKGRRLIFA